jgi:hypothetical protein
LPRNHHIGIPLNESINTLRLFKHLHHAYFIHIYKPECKLTTQQDVEKVMKSIQDVEGFMTSFDSHKKPEDLLPWMKMLLTEAANVMDTAEISEGRAQMYAIMKQLALSDVSLLSLRDETILFVNSPAHPQLLVMAFCRGIFQGCEKVTAVATWTGSNPLSLEPSFMNIQLCPLSAAGVGRRIFWLQPSEVFRWKQLFAERYGIQYSQQEANFQNDAVQIVLRQKEEL